MMRAIRLSLSRRVISLALMLLGVGVLRASTPCDLTPETAAFLASLPADPHAIRAAIEARLNTDPDNFTLNRLFLDSSVYEKSPVRERYRNLLDAHPGNLDYEYLRARSLVGRDTKEALRLYSQILAMNPDYPWVHLSQLEIYRSEKFRDRKALDASFAAITRVCPALFEPYRYLNELADSDLAVRAAEKLRQMLQATKDPRKLGYFATLWAAEFRLRPASGADLERQTIRMDLRQLLPFEAQLRFTIETGAKLSGDATLEARVAVQRPPDVNHSVMSSSNAWLRDHPRPNDDAPRENKIAWARELLAKSEEWQRMEPDSIIPYSNRLTALILLNAPEKEIVAAAGRMLAVPRNNDAALASWMVHLAREYMKGGVLLDRVPGLISEALKLLDDPEAVIEIDLAPSREITAINRARVAYDHNAALLVLAQTFEKLGHRDRAHETLWQAADFIASKEAAFPTNEGRDWLTMARYETLRTRAEIAEREGRKLDALNGYRETLMLRPIGRDELLARQRKLWKELGGSDEGWQQWASSIPAASAARNTAPSPAQAARHVPALERKLPPFSLRDIRGEQWTLESFRGKTVVAVVWASWCEPCRAELPYFARLAERLSGRADILALSFNTDENPAIAESFAASQGYKFPVLLAKQYAEDLMPEFAIPRTWIIKNAAITSDHVGFGPDGQKWIDEVIAALK